MRFSASGIKLVCRDLRISVSFGFGGRGHQPRAGQETLFIDDVP